jgi:DNA-binding PadR family transcriptional regulator
LRWPINRVTGTESCWTSPNAAAAKVKLSPGTLYGAIKQMLEDGLIEETASRAVEDDERRRYYRLTRHGRETARQEMARMSALLNHARLTSLRSSEG